MQCECKAHEEQIEQAIFSDFFGKLCHGRSNNKALKGSLFSTSGFNGTAQKNNNELSEDKRFSKIRQL